MGWSEGESSPLTLPLPTSQGLVSRYEFSPEGRLLQQDNPDGTHESFLYDLAGNRTALINAQGDTTRFVLDENNNVVETSLPDGARIRQEYDELNQVIARIDALGRTMTDARLGHSYYNHLKRGCEAGEGSGWQPGRN